MNNWNPLQFSKVESTRKPRQEIKTAETLENKPMGNNAVNCSTLGTLPQDPACGSLTNEIPGVITTAQMTLEVLTSITSCNDILLYHLQLTENSSVLKSFL